MPTTTPPPTTTTSRVPRARLTRAECGSLGVAAVGLVVFGVHGVAHHEASTPSYVFSVILVGAGIAVFRRQPLPGWLAAALAALAIGHLAGGLVTVGGDVLYNAHPHLHVFQYDHIFHASASGTATVGLWLFLSGEMKSKPGAVVVAVLGGLGVGAINELIEFLATLAHNGGHVGGYRNTGWDLLSNTVGATVAMLVVFVRGRRRAPA